MLNILENCHPTRIFIVLIRLMAKYKSGASLQKMKELIIKCLLKLTKIMSGPIHQIEIDKLLLVIHEYLSEYKLAKIGYIESKAIQTILTEVVKLQGHTIWTSYEKIRKHSVPDVYMEKWITEILNSSLNESSALITPSSKPIDIISDIFSTIKCDYAKGFTQLIDHFTANPTADYTSYISTLPIELQQKVREDLEVMLKKKDSITESPYNLQDLKKRVSEMKQRYGIETPKAKSSDFTLEKAKPSDVMLEKAKPSDVMLEKAKPSDVTLEKAKPSDVTLDNPKNTVLKKNGSSSSMNKTKSRIQNTRNKK
ncbi:hypothetical protein SteCoe_17880 [Stentor coeruleus]|uniref:Uncharacterized protein n=1 Tax=Stentor coeruleus TaxID=5963 RepID=A0A1R2BY95_9CILI|nr:hypothetical protein SteCoe_17880 [Stentor coeruleus]